MNGHETTSFRGGVAVFQFDPLRLDISFIKLLGQIVIKPLRHLLQKV